MARTSLDSTLGAARTVGFAFKMLLHLAAECDRPTRGLLAMKCMLRATDSKPDAIAKVPITDGVGCHFDSSLDQH
jgi:hypothetical protein